MGRKEAPRRVAVIGGGAGGLCAATAAGKPERTFRFLNRRTASAKNCSNRQRAVQSLEYARFAGAL